MLHRSSPGLAVRLLLLVVVGAAATALPSAASGASSPPVVSATNCNGSLTRAPTASDPNNIAYKFRCDWGITGYTITVTRRPDDFATVDDFSSDVSIVDPSGNPVPGGALLCGGSIPGNGINCAGKVAAPNYVEGSFDTSDVYCAHYPAHPRLHTAPIPQAIVSLVVNDARGATDGPFRLSLSPACSKPVNPAVAKQRRERKHKKRHG